MIQLSELKKEDLTKLTKLKELPSLRITTYSRFPGEDFGGLGVSFLAHNKAWHLALGVVLNQHLVAEIHDYVIGRMKAMVKEIIKEKYK